jgi:hypothetical protein
VAVLPRHGTPQGEVFRIQLVAPVAARDAAGKQEVSLVAHIADGSGDVLG